MSEHPNAVLVRELVEMLVRDDLAGVSELIADDVVWHYIGGAEPVRGKEAMITGLRLSGNADWTITAQIHDVTASDDHAVALLNTHATRGDRTLDCDTAEVYHIKDGKVRAHWACSDDTARIIEFYA
mgnify:FL=1